MSSKFDAYDVIGVITPGSILLFGLIFLFPDLSVLRIKEGYSLGDLGMFLLLSFVAGHLIQAVGNALEALVWNALGGMPTDWLIKKPEKVLHPAQFDRVRQAIAEDFGCDLSQVSKTHWASIVREMYAAVQTDGDTGRIDTFNRGYGLMRGVAASLVFLAVTALILKWPSWWPALLVSAVALVAAYRMVRFAKNYGRELVVAYLRVVASRSG